MNPIGVGLVVAVWAVCIGLVLRLRYTVRRARLPQRAVVLRPIVIPARYGAHTFTDAEVVERFLAVDWLLSHRDFAGRGR